jgi:hypothetical protein
LKKTLSVILRVLKIIFFVLVGCYIIVFGYVSLNKKKIIKQVATEISSKINGNVSIGNIELSFFSHFPKVALLLNDVSVTDTLFPQHHHVFFAAKKVYINLSIPKLVRRLPPVSGLIVENGSVYLYTDSTGYTNQYLTHPKRDAAKSTTNSGSDNALKSIELEDMRIILDDRQRNKLYDFTVDKIRTNIEDGADEVMVDVNAAIGIKSLAFNLGRGSFLKDKTFRGGFEIRYDKKLGQLQFDSINVKLQGIPVNLSGRFDLQGAAPQFALRIHVRNAEYEGIKSLLPTRIATSLSMIKLSTQLDADATISGPLKGGEPLVLINWLVNKADMPTPFMDFTEASFSGYYKNEVTPGFVRNDSNSVIVLSEFTAKWQNLPVSANRIEILNLDTPQLICDMHSSFQLSELNEVIATNSLKLTGGAANMRLTYKGPLVNNTSVNSFINGNLDIKDGVILYEPRNVEMKAVNGSIVFSNSDVLVQNLQCNVLDNKIVMNGTAQNLLSLINTAPNKVEVNWNIYSPQLNLASFIYLLKTNTAHTGSAPSSKNKFAKVSTQIDDLLEQSKINVNLKTDRVLYKKFQAQNLKASVALLPDRYVLNNVSMAIAGGTMSLGGQLLNGGAALHTASVKTTFTNVDVQKIFYAFDNFGQDGITSQSLEGKLTAKANASFAMNDDGKLLPSSTTGNIDFSLKNGALNNYEPIKKIQDFIFKKRDFDNIRFAELKDHLDINKGEVTINRMEIQSSVLSLFMEGLFSQKGSTDISIQVPLSNLKKRKEDYDPENIGSDKKGGRSIFLRGRPGSDGNVNFKLDLFNKYKKDKKNNVENK